MIERVTQQNIIWDPDNHLAATIFTPTSQVFGGIVFFAGGGAWQTDHTYLNSYAQKAAKAGFLTGTFDYRVWGDESHKGEWYEPGWTDAQNAVDYMAKLAGSTPAALGSSWGGMFSNRLAIEGQVRRAVTWSGGHRWEASVSTEAPTVPLQIAHCLDDQSVPVDEDEDVADAYLAGGVYCDAHFIPGAWHARELPDHDPWVWSAALSFLETP